MRAEFEGHVESVTAVAGNGFAPVSSDGLSGESLSMDVPSGECIGWFGKRVRATVVTMEDKR